MFGIFRKKQKKVFNNFSDEPIDMDKVRVWYEGEVVSGDYDINDTEDYPYHNLFPHGQGHIKYKLSGRNVEEFRGSFKGGQYHGKGILVDRFGEVFEGEFWENNYVGDLQLIIKPLPLAVPYFIAKKLKKLGAKWHPEWPMWYSEIGTDRKPFKKWLFNENK